MLDNAFSYVLYGLKDGLETAQMSYLTKYYFLIDWLTAFFMQWLLLYLPYQWYFPTL